MPLWNNVATTAMSMATAEIRFPRRADSARPNILRPVMKRIDARMYASSVTTATPSAFLVPGAEHAEHAVGDHVAADDVDGGQRYGQRGEQRAEGAVDRGGGHGAHQRDARDGVAARHQRRVQLRRDLADELEAQEHGQHEDEQQ